MCFKNPEPDVGKCLVTWSKNGELPKGSVTSNGLVVRYADDFVILYPHLEILERVVTKVKKWLFPLCLEISKYKSSIRHTLYEYNGVPLRYYLSQKLDRDRVQTHVVKSTNLKIKL